MDISKLKIGGEVHNISPFTISYTEPQGEDRLPMWICPNTSVYSSSFTYQMNTQSISGTTKYMIAYYYIDSEGKLQQSISDYIYSSNNDAIASIPTDKKVVILCDSYNLDNTTYQLNSVKKHQVYPNMEYALEYYFWRNVPDYTVPLKVFWYDINEDLLDIKEITLSLASGTISLGKSPKNSCYCLITLPYGNLEEVFLQIDVEHEEHGTYILNPENDMYYKIS